MPRLVVTRSWSRAAPYVVALVVAFYLVRVLGAPWPRFRPTFPDSASFLHDARVGPFHPGFYFDDRAIGFPLFAWALVRSPTLVVVAQTVLYVLAFALLGRVLLRTLSSRVVAYAAIVLVVSIAVEPRNSLWNTLILSESLSSTLAVLTIAAWLNATSRPGRGALRWAFAATAAWVLVRDTSMIPAALTVVPVALAVWLVTRRRSPLAHTLAVGALVLAGVCAYTLVSQNVGNRGVDPVFNNVGLRVLPDPSLTKWFVAQGMPIDDAVRGRTGRDTWDDDAAFLDDPELAHIRAWARDSGSRVVVESFLVRAPDWWRRLHHALPHLLSYRNADYDSYGVGHRLPTVLPPPLGEPRTTGGLFAGLVLAAAAIGVVALDRERRLVALFAVVALSSALLDLYVSYGGDAVETERHVVGPLLRLAVTLVVTIAFGVDAVFRMVRARRATSGAPAPAARADASADV